MSIHIFVKNKNYETRFIGDISNGRYYNIKCSGL